MRLRYLALGAALLAGVMNVASAQSVDAALVARGAYVARAADCAACHTDPAAGRPYAGGCAIQSPLGTIYSTNITSSHSHGIGEWSEADFARAVREGVAKDGTHLYPAMPYDAYSGMTDDDVHALYTYFQSVAPMDQAPKKQTSLGFPYGIRASMVAWNALFLDHHRYESQNGEVPDASRGKYLVDVLGHCGSCHTPRTTLMSADNGNYLAGADIGGWHAPNITSDATDGLGGWTEDEIASFLQNGHVAGKAVAAGGMAEAVEHSLRHLSDADLHAMAAYLKTVPARPAAVTTSKASYSYGEPASGTYDFGSTAAVATETAASAARTGTAGTPSNSGKPSDMTNGAQLFEAACATCHQPAGSGTGDHYYPSLYRNSTTGAATPNNLVMTILEGVKRVGADGPTAMPAFKEDLDDTQVAAIATFVSKQFGNPGLTIDAARVAELRRGGPPAKLQQLMPWMLGVGGLLIVALIVLMVRLATRRKRIR